MNFAQSETSVLGELWEDAKNVSENAENIIVFTKNAFDIFKNNETTKQFSKIQNFSVET